MVTDFLYRKLKQSSNHIKNDSVNSLTIQLLLDIFYVATNSNSIDTLTVNASNRALASSIII